MKIITISREFGSGGRELGKRMADLLGWDYYDREIISAIAQRQGLDEGHVARMLEHQGWREIPLTFRRSFAGLALTQAPATALLLEQKAVIEKIPQAGRDCIIVGRCGDYVHRSYPDLIDVFIYADMEDRVRRIMDRYSFSERDAVNAIKSTDRRRKNYYENYTKRKWGSIESHQMLLNISKLGMDKTVRIIKGIYETP